jgi:hypothetical protein
MIFGGKNLYCARRVVASFPAFDRTGARKPLRRGNRDNAAQSGAARERDPSRIEKSFKKNTCE